VSPGQRVLEIGFGWGSLSLLLAKHFGARVTGITLSEQQLSLATQRVKDAGLEHLIDFHLVDYRVHQPANGVAYDRIVSCEMLEAVGHEYMPDYFRHCGRLLAPGGVLVVQVITTPEGRYDAYRRSTDFIKEYIFPGCCCPSLAAVLAAAGAGGGFTLAASEEIGTHYAPTLLRWREAFMANAGPLKALGFNDAFIRCWDCACPRNGYRGPSARTDASALFITRPQTTFSTALQASPHARSGTCSSCSRSRATPQRSGTCPSALSRRDSSPSSGGERRQPQHTALVVSADSRNTQCTSIEGSSIDRPMPPLWYPSIHRFICHLLRACLRRVRPMLGRGLARVATCGSPAADGGTCLTSLTASA